MQKRVIKEEVGRIVKKIMKGEQGFYFIGLDDDCLFMTMSKERIELDTFLLSLNDDEGPAKLYGHIQNEKVGEFNSIKIAMDFQDIENPKIFILIDDEPFEMESIYLGKSNINVLCEFKLGSILFAFFKGIGLDLLGTRRLVGNHKREILFHEYLFLNTIQKSNRNEIENKLMTSLNGRMSDE